MMKHVMLDLETWGTTPGCAIRSVGAVFFSPTGSSLGVDFYANISDESCNLLKMHVWSHGAGFDIVLWEAACRVLGWSPPWRFVDVRDTRTVLHMANLRLSSVAREGTHHHALDDAKHQAVCIQRAYHELREAAPCT